MGLGRGPGLLPRRLRRRSQHATLELRVPGDGTQGEIMKGTQRATSRSSRTIRHAWKALWVSGCLVGSLASCGSQHVLRVTSQPSGALVRLDEDVIGTTPLEYEFQHFGHRRISLYRVGYRSYSEPIHLKAPWHARFPMDVFAEVLIPLGLDYSKDHHVVLEVDDGEQVYESLSTFVERAEDLRRALPGQVPSAEEIGAPVDASHPPRTLFYDPR